MRVLFVPMPEGGPAHLIPLLALNKMLSGSAIETAFLLGRASHELLRQMGVNVLDIDHLDFAKNGFRTELRAYHKFAPDVVVDDASLTTGYATTMMKIPRVAIQRTGIFPGDAPRNPNHTHSMRLVEDTDQLPDLTFLGLRQHRSLTDFFKAEHKIVPGVRSVEVLPPHLREDPTYHFAGPLLIEDYMIEKVGWRQAAGLKIDDLKRFDALRKFFEAQRGRKLVYLTFGTMAKPSAAILEAIRYLLSIGIAVVSSVGVDGLSPAEQELYYFAQYLPMHFVCSHVDLMIHQCGSGTYQYPIIHNVPTMTIGTQHFDREHVALRLEELGVSVHLPAPEECADFDERFRAAVRRYFDETGAFIAEKKRNLAALNAEIERTRAAFNFESVLRAAVNSARDSHAA